MDTGCAKPPSAPLKQSCPSCKATGKSVQTTTVRSLAQSERCLDHESGFHFCATPTCSVVYFEETGKTLLESDLRVPVWQKREDPTTPVCYCFGWSEERIRSEIAETGRCTAVSAISAQVKAGACACGLKNPQGSCCLGNVTQVVKKLLTAHKLRKPEQLSSPGSDRHRFDD